MWYDKLFLTVFGFGYAPKAPGTFGTIAGLGIYLALYMLLPDTYNYLAIGLIIICTILGSISTDRMEKDWGEDPSRVVIDEAIGIWITMLFLPINWTTAILGFVLFRFFDILKPLGIGTIDKKMNNGFGVMLDDIVAGIYAHIVIRIILYFL